jgi:hypothetical protein
LKELLLDGCEHLDDYAVVCLTEKFSHSKPQTAEVAELYNYSQRDRLAGPLYYELKGGARGLEKLSLGECRQITDQGLGYLRKLGRLKELNLLGCYSITDEGLRVMTTGATQLTRLNLSGTCITRDGLRLLGEKLPNLSQITANCCRLLSTSDRALLPGVTLDINEDIFRFQLEPTPGSKLPHITSNVLRTRGSLSILRVNNYVCRRLDQSDIAVDVRATQILYQDKVLTPYQTLHEIGVRSTGGMLSLQYRLKEETAFVERLKRMQGHLVSLPKWVDDEASQYCQECKEPFKVLKRRHHCRKCGRLLCSDCTPWLEFLPELGYTKDRVRICSACSRKS